MSLPEKEKLIASCAFSIINTTNKTDAASFIEVALTEELYRLEISLDEFEKLPGLSREVTERGLTLFLYHAYDSRVELFELPKLKVLISEVVPAIADMISSERNTIN